MPPRTRSPRPVPTFDHLQKKPLERRVPIVLDDGPLVALEEARRDLEVAEQKAGQERDRLFHLTRSKASTGKELLELDERITARLDAELAPLREAVEKAEEAVRAATVWFTVRSIGRRAYSDLLAAHPPRDEDHEDARRDTRDEGAVGSYNGETFPPALILASVVDPELTAEQVEDIWATWNHAEIVELFVAALAVNTQRRVSTLGKARG